MRIYYQFYLFYFKLVIFDWDVTFINIVNHLMSLGKEFDKEELSIKVLKCLDRSWQPKVTAILESKDFHHHYSYTIWKAKGAWNWDAKAKWAWIKWEKGENHSLEG